MTVTSPPPPRQRRSGRVDPARAVSGRRRVTNALATSWMIGSLLLALVPVVVIAVYVVSEARR